MVPGFHGLFAFFVLSRMSFRVLHHLLDLVLAEPTRCRNLDGLFLSGAEILRGDMNDSIGVDVECDLDLRNPSRRHRNANQIELPQKLVISSHLSFALENPDRNCRLIVLSRRKDLALLRRNRRVPVDQLRENAAKSFNSERQWGDVQKQDIFDFTLENRRLNRSSNRDDLIGIDAAVRLLPEDLPDPFLYGRHAGHASDENDFVNVARAESGIL